MNISVPTSLKYHCTYELRDNKSYRLNGGDYCYRDDGKPKPLKIPISFRSKRIRSCGAFGAGGHYTMTQISGCKNEPDRSNNPRGQVKIVTNSDDWSRYD
jgi:hypothetical protein